MESAGTRDFINASCARRPRATIGMGMPFRDVVGHGALVRLIARAVARDTLPPTLLFVGPDGVGKRLVALGLAQVENCRSRGSTPTHDLDACGECPTCRRIARGSYPDVPLIVPGETGSITIDPIRHVIGEAGYRPFEGQRRVVIIADADRVVTPAQNALLKILEEPPDSTRFVLVTARPDLLLPTVRSRCQRLNFGRLMDQDVVKVLDRLRGDDAEDAHVAAAAAGGSVARALELSSRESVTARDAAVALLVAVSSARHVKARLEGAKALVGKTRPGAPARQELTRRLRALTTLLRDSALLATGCDRRGLANTDVGDGLAGLSRTYGGARGLKAFAAVGRALDAVDRNVSPKVVADWLACQL